MIKKHFANKFLSLTREDFDGWKFSGCPIFQVGIFLEPINILLSKSTSKHFSVSI